MTHIMYAELLGLKVYIAERRSVWSPQEVPDLLSIEVQPINLDNIA